MSSAPITGCTLAFQCPMRWSELDPIATDGRTRFCQQCQATVHWADTPEEAELLGDEGKCVALGFVEDLKVGQMQMPSFLFGGLSTKHAEAGLWGLLVGDAVGVPYEFHPPKALPPREAIDLVPPKGFIRAHAGVPPGTWSDDGAQALALLDTLVTTGGVDLSHFAGNLKAWLHEGRFAVNRSVFDVGRQTATAINRLMAGTAPERAGPSAEQDNGNGSLMRVFPLLMQFWPSDLALIDAAITQSKVTHGHPRAHVACAFYCLWLMALVMGGKRRASSTAEEQMRSLFEDAGLPEDELEQVLDPMWRKRASGSGYVVDTLWSARIAVEETGDFASCIRRAIAFGHDTDTTAAVAGAAAGVLYGLDGIPREWREALRGRDILDPLLDRWRSRRQQD